MTAYVPYDPGLYAPRGGGSFPYHDPDRLADFLEDDAQRGTGTVVLAITVHVALFFALSGNFMVPDLKPDEPDVIPVQVVIFEAPQPDPESVAKPPVIPVPARAPRREPRLSPPPVPEPEPEPEFPPPPPETQPEPDPQLEPESSPTLPEILAEPVVEPELEAIPAPELIPEPETLEPEPEPIIPDPEPILEPEPVIEPEIEAEPFITPVPDIVTPELEPELLPIEELPPVQEPDVPEPEILEPKIVEPDPEPIVEPDPEPIVEPDPEPIVEPELLPDPIVIDPEIITVPPTILASPEAPETIIEERRAVPQEQSDPFMDLMRQDRPLGPANTADPGQVRRPSSNPLTGPTSGGGTQRNVPGMSGWTLAPGSYGNSLGAGYEGIILDIRCREAGKTHLECPKYLRTFQGREADGFESYERYKARGVTNMVPAGVSPGFRRGNSVGRNIAGGTDPWAGGIGNNSINAGGPSTTLLDDGPEVDFSREFLENRIRIEDDANRVRDLFREPDPDETRIMIDELVQPEPDPEEER